MIKAVRKVTSMVQPAAPVACAWRHGAYHCKLRPTSGRYCVWHAYWLRLVDAGTLGRSQYDEFGEWWEQFQPYGIYGDNPGPWWAAIEVLWPALTGLGEPPVLIPAIGNELLLRRAEVRHYQQGLAWGRDPWPRVSGLPLPVWEREQWQKRVDQLKKCEVA